jgi:hypothetical protein
LVASLRVKIDISLLGDLLDYIQNTQVDALERIIEHPAAIKTFNHAIRFGNTSENIRYFWRGLLDLGRNHRLETVQAVGCCLDHLRSHRDMYEALFDELQNYLPDDCNLDAVLYGIIGYDVGIVSDGSAILNLAHPWFQEDTRELPFMAMHELHHVGFTHYNPLFKMEDLGMTSDLRRIIRYATHLEGLAVYAPLEKRVEYTVLNNLDYPVLLDARLRDRRVREFFSVVEKLDEQEDRPLAASDMEMLEDMSGHDCRLWYIAGAHMAMNIDEDLGRRALIQTIVDGPDSFFDAYRSLV